MEHENPQGAMPLAFAPPTLPNQLSGPLQLAATLAGSGLFADYLLYEANGSCWFGGGVARALTLFADRIEIRERDKLSRRAVEAQDHCQALSRELARWPGEWQAGGWACFELAYALSAPELLSADERAGLVPLAYVFQPEVRVELGERPLAIHGQTPELEGRIREVLAGPAMASAGDPFEVQVGDSPTYRRGVESAVDHIHSGLLQKVILSRQVNLECAPDFVATWLRGRLNNNPARSFTLRLGGWQASGFSPEVVVTVDRHGQVVTEPLAGTRRLDGVEHEDRNRFNELYSDTKETHERAISVRLSLDEMREVCEPSSVCVQGFMERKLRGSVQHLASTVCGKLRADLNAWHAFATLFPAVTASGIPKQQAFEEICRLEQTRRGLYAGAVLRVNHDGPFEAALVLRSLLGRGASSWLQAGAGIVSGSRPERELTETSEKMASVAPWVVRKHMVEGQDVSAPVQAE